MTDATTPQPDRLLPGHTVADVLRLLGYVVLVLGLIGAAWAFVGALAATNQDAADLGIGQGELDVTGVGMAIGLALASLTWCALLVGVARVVDNTVEIARRLAGPEEG